MGGDFKNENIPGLESLHNLKRKAYRKIDGIASQVQKLEEQVIRDSLTGLYDWEACDEKVGAFKKGAVMMMDLREFKNINDNYGHPFGDRVLKTVANQMEANIKAEKDFLARKGGDEFVLLVEDVTEDQAREIAERLSGKINGLKVEYRKTDAEGITNTRNVTVFMDIGVAMKGEEDDIEECIGRADKAMYAAKEASKVEDMVVVWSEELGKSEK